MGVSDRDLCLPSNRKVGKGGVAIMLRSALSNNIPVLDIDSDRSSGIQYRLCNKLRDLSSCLDRDSVNFSCADIKNVLSQLKTKKACGRDGIHNEHLQIGGDTMIRELSILCTDMYNHGHIPDSLKQGVIITLHKGGRKSKKDPNNYHAISLTSSILKVFERLILPMLENNLERPYAGCNVSSLMLKECIAYAKVYGSKLFACFLDAQEAFDKVWHNGLFLKLYNMGIRSKLLRIVIGLHHNLTSCVLHMDITRPIFQSYRDHVKVVSYRLICTYVS